MNPEVSSGLKSENLPLSVNRRMTKSYIEAPPALRILLLALAVIDDVGAILVIALFYSSELAALGFAVLVLGILAVITLQILGVRSPLAYVGPAIVVWAGAYLGAIHPTLAGAPPFPARVRPIDLCSAS
jgi:Na+/H+ antiporter NhaA